MQDDPRCISASKYARYVEPDLPDQMRVRGTYVIESPVERPEARLGLTVENLGNLPGFWPKSAKAIVLTDRATGEQLDRLVIGRQSLTHSQREWLMLPGRVNDRGLRRDLSAFTDGRIPDLFRAMPKEDRDALLEMARSRPIAPAAAKAGLTLEDDRMARIFLEEACRGQTAAALPKPLRDRLWQAVMTRAPALHDSYLFRKTSACNPTGLP